MKKIIELIKKELKGKDLDQIEDSVKWAIGFFSRVGKAVCKATLVGWLLVPVINIIEKKLLKEADKIDGQVG